MSLANARIVRQRVRCRCCFLHRFLEMTYSAHRTGKVVSYQKGIGMRKYLEFFRVEAKSLLKNFQKNEQSAVARCAEVFGDKKDLSLMNMQHVVAKEYGFDNWNALYKAENWQLAEALIKSKNQVLSMPLYGDERKGNVYSRAERYEIGLIKSREGVDLENFVQTSPSGYASPFLQLERFDLSDYDLAKMNPLFVSFDEYTRWPEDVAKLPQNFNPQNFMEQRKNPGLGIRRLHRQNLAGHGRAVAVIDGFLLCDHLEYHENLKGYERICSDDLGRGASGGTLVSAFVGKTCGVAPFADVYYFSAQQMENGQRTQRYYAQALQKVCDIHEELLQKGKNGIDTVCILWGITSPVFQQDEGVSEMKKALERAKNLNIWVNSGDLKFEGKLWSEGRIHCSYSGDLDNPMDYEVMPNAPKIPLEVSEFLRNRLCFPAGGRTVAVDDRLDAYMFSAPGFYLKPYECGLFVLARSIKNDLTAEEFWQLGLETGDYRAGVGVIVNPQKLIDALRK